MSKLELQKKIATIEKNISLIKTPALLANLQKNLKDAKEKLAALEKGSPAPAPSGGSSELEELYAQREVLKKNLSSENPVVQKTAKTALPKVEARIAELEGASPAPAPSPAPAKRGRKPKAEAPVAYPKKRGRKPKAETPAEEKPKIRRGRKPKAEAPAEVPVAPVRRGRKPKAPAETPAKAPAKRGRPALPKGARSKEVSIDSLTKLGNAIVMFCNENGIESPTLADVKEILYILDKSKALRYAKGGKISKSGSYLSKWQIKQILTDGGMKIGSDEILSGIWLKKKGRDVAQMRMGGEVGYFVIDDDILDSGKSVMLGTRKISAKNKKFQGVFMGKMVGGVMKVYDYDDEMWKAVNPDEWQQAYAEGGGVRGNTITDLRDFDPNTTEIILGDANFGEFPNIIDLGVLSEIKGNADFFSSEIESLGNLKTIGGSADFENSRIRSLGRLKTIGGDVSFAYSQVQNLGNLQTISGDAHFENSQVQSLGNLQTIGGYADFRNSQIQDLGNLHTIGNMADFRNSQIQDLGNLQTIDGDVFWGERTDLQNEWEMRQGKRK